MKYQEGDKVLILHSGEEGIVIEIMKDKMVLIEVDGIRFPVYADQIDFPYFKRFSEKKIVKSQEKKVYIDQIKKEKPQDRYKVSSGVWLSFLPVFDKDVFDDDIVEKFKMYLVNHTAENYNFSYMVNFSGSPGFDVANRILPFTDFYLHDILFETMNDAPKFEFDFSLVEIKKNKAEHFETVVKIKAKQLFQKLEEMRLKNEPTFSFLLFETYPDKLEDLAPDYHHSDNFYNVSRIREKLEPARSVVDLHIEKLTDNWKGLSNFEILTIQLRNFEKYYQLAIAHRQPNLVIIHGVGTGKLRQEIHEILKLKREVKSFANQYHSNFGFGATEIFFQY